jgi:1-acyl-sn-glycerol-3-phosphate acyltransferase
LHNCPAVFRFYCDSIARIISTNMPTPTLRPRIQLIALMAAWWILVFCFSQLATRSASEVLSTEKPYLAEWVAVAGTVVLLMLVSIIFNWPLVFLASRARWWPARVVGLMALLGILGLWMGAMVEFAAAFGASPPPEISIFVEGIIGNVIFIMVICAIPWEQSARTHFFLFDRSHASNAIAVRALVAAFGHALLVAVAIALALKAPSEPGEPPFPRLLWRGGIAYLIGMFLSLWQRFPQRLAGLIPISALLSAIALIAAWIAAGAEWPILFLAFALGLAHTAARNDLLANLTPRQRPAGLALMILAQALGVLAAIFLMYLIPSIWLAGTLAAIGLAALAVRFFLRELIELLVEPILTLMYPIRGYGPGAKIVPTRGPLLILANHTTWIDPLWVAKLMPLRVRPLMTSRFYDLPLISWLMRKVFHTIRVPDSRFRRETPEIQLAVAALERGENVLIFPEGWLKRREDLTLRRFGQGVYQILREKPQTPVVVCWIEGGWGTYMSYWKGPPTKNKKIDLFRRIRIGIAEPEILNLKVLSDQMQTRRYLMQACLRARTYLGLPELEMPPFGGEEEDDEKNEA